MTPECDLAPVVVVSPDLRPGIAPMLQGLDDAGLLRELVTTIAIDPSRVGAAGTPRSRLLSRAGALLPRRITPEAAVGKTHTYPYRELVRTIGRRVVRNEIVGDRLWWWSERGFDRYVARTWAGQSPVVYGFELASAETFRVQKARGGITILGQLIAHHRTVYQLLEEEFAAFPEAFSAYERRALAMGGRVNALKDAQYDASDVIVANSDFVRDSFVAAGVPGSKLVVVPSAGPSIESQSRDGLRRKRARPLFVAAGTLSIRKGTHYLLEAWRGLDGKVDADLLLVGSNHLPSSLLVGLPSSVHIRQTVPAAELSQIYSNASALVLPSLCEGFALVVLEAMAHGLPVITTPNSGAGEFVQDGENGWIVPIRDAESLADRLAWSADHPEALAAMGEKSRKKAEGWTWDDYGRTHAEVISRYLDEKL